MNQRKRKGIAWLLVFAVIIGNILPSGAGMAFAKGKSSQGKESLTEKDGLDNLANPRIVKDSNMEAGQKVTWDCVWFGSYPQAEVVPASEKYIELDENLVQEGDLIQDDTLYQKLVAATGWDKQGDVEVDGEKYRRIKKEDATATVSETQPYPANFYQWKNETDYHYFKYQPIKWRVLSVNGAEAFLLADKALDDKKYYTVFKDVTWEGSTIRSWLNGYGASANKQNKDYSSSNFIGTAFGKEAKEAIKDTEVKNKENLSGGTVVGNDTVDKIFLLSESEVYTDAAKSYGFVSDSKINDEARRSKSSVYAKALGTWGSAQIEDYLGNGEWWLRSQVCDPNRYYYATSVDLRGACKNDSIVDSSWSGVRPALNLKLTASSDSAASKVWSYAGTVCSDGTVNEKKTPEKVKDSLSNPCIVPDSNMEAGQKVTWDCVWFGSYPQAEVVPASEKYTELDENLVQDGDLIQDDTLYQKLVAATGWDKQGDVEVDGEKYRRIKKEDATATVSETQPYPANFYQWKNETDYHYFKYQPIKWRVLSVNGAEAFLLADKALDDKKYYTVFKDVTWEGSTIRSWLNGYGASANKQNKDYSSSNFIGTAFGKEAKEAIKDTEVKNKENLSGGTVVGNDTVDKIFLLSESEVYTDAAKSYGFVSDSKINDEARRSKSSVYAKALGTWSLAQSGDYAGNAGWWLRSQRCEPNRYYFATDVSPKGVCKNESIIDDPWNGVRPALNLKLTVSSDSAASKVWSYAGTVCSDGTVNEKAPYEKVSFSNPRIEEDSSMKAGQKVTWDCVWFGSYPQAEVVPEGDATLNRDLSEKGNFIKDSILYQKLQLAAGWDKKGEIMVDGEKYRRIEKKEYNKSTVHYYKYQPVKWRILSVDSSKAFLLADKVLDNRPYHVVQEDITWEESTIRSWLNGYDASANKQKQDYSGQNFIQAAFDVSEQSAIAVTDVKNQDNLSFGTEGGADTKDKVFLLSESELYTDAAKKYGFSPEATLPDEARKTNSANTLIDEEWWIRSPGLESFYASRVEDTGYIFCDGNFDMSKDGGVRPALNLDLTALGGMAASKLYSYAGTVCSDGTENEEVFVEQKTDITQCDIILDKTSYIYDGTTKWPKVTIKYGNTLLEDKKDYTLFYYDNMNAGKATVLITGKGDYEGKASRVFTIEPKSISSTDICLEKDSYTYDGEAKTPSVSVTDDKVTLTDGVDYTVTYMDNISSGTAKAIVTGMGNYTGSKEKDFLIVTSVDEEQDKAVGVNVKYHTQQEIRDYVRKNKASTKDVLAFAENPVTDKPYALGKLSDATLQSATAMLNQVRYIAGISDEVQLLNSYNELAQAATLANYVNDELSHYPVQPAGMSDDMYTLAKEGASSSNIAWASWPNRSMNETIVSGWMEDGDSSNIDRVGHRRWILNPKMGKTGFGAVSGKNGTYSAVYAFDNSNGTAQEYGVMWPAQNMPVEYFGEEYPWSISMGYAVDESRVQVRLTRKKDGRKWSFSKVSADGDFYVNNAGYGQKGCIIFRPDQGIDKYEAGEEFQVKITGLEQGDVSYTVVFFALAGETDPTASPRPTETPVSSRWPVAVVTPNPVVTPNQTATAMPSPTAVSTPSVMPGPVSTVTPEPSIAIPTPGVTPVPDGTPDAMPTWEPDATVKPIITPETVDDSDVGPKKPTKKLKKGSKITDKKTNATYKVTKAGNKKAVEYIKSSGKEKSNISVPAAVKLQGKTFKVTSIAKNAFKKNKKLESVSIGKNVKKVGSGVFNGCKNLEKVTIGKNVTAIEASAFRGCNSLTMVTIPSKVKKIGANAFRQCKNLRYIMVKTKKLTPENIGKNAFSGGCRLPRIKTDKSIWKPYSKIFLKRGISGKAVFIIDPVKLVI